MDFDPVESGCHRPASRFDKSLSDMIDIELTHFIRYRIRLTGQWIILFGRHRTRRDHPTGRIDLRPCHTTAVKHLHDGNSALFLNAGDNRPPSVDLALSQNPRLPRISLGTFIIGHNRLGENDRSTLSGSANQEIEYVPARDALLYC